MSRHRFVKNLTEDDYYDDYEYSEEEYDAQGDGGEGTVKIGVRLRFLLLAEISEKRLKLKGLLGFKRPSTDVVSVKVGKNTAIFPKVKGSERGYNNRGSSSISDSITPDGGMGAILPSLASLSLGSTAPSSLSLLASLGMSGAKNSTVGTPLAKPQLKLSDLMSNSSTPPLSLSQILNGTSGRHSASSAPQNAAFGSLNASSDSQPKITLTDLMNSASIPVSASSVTAAIVPAAINSQYHVVEPLEASSFASFLDYTPPPTPHTIDLTSFIDGNNNKVAYSFNESSPDDIVQQARQKNPAATAAKTALSSQKNASSNDSLSKTLATNLNISSVKKAPKQSIKNKIDVAKEYEKRSSEQESLNLVVVGHVDAGKSTLMGHLLVQLGEIKARTISKFKKEADEVKKGSFMYAWVLDSTEDERNRGVTIDYAVAHFTTIKKKRRYILLDAPGHQDFVEKMVAGTSQADVAVLVVDAGAGGFESGFDKGGQTREHALLLKALGVGQVIVGINKMDIAQWNQERYNEIREKMLEFLVSIARFDPADVQFVPLSGFTGENLCKSVGMAASWYEGPTLVDALDIFHVPKRSIDRPFALSVQDYFKGGIGPGGGGSVTVSGRIDSGSVQVGDFVLAMPINETGSVKAIQMGDETMSQWAVAGDRVSITLSDLDPIKIHLGSVLCSNDQPIPTTQKFKAAISTFDLEIPLTLGIPVVLHHLGTVEAGTITTMENSIDSEGTCKKRPRVISSRSTATVTIHLERPISCQIASISLELGRFLLRKGKVSVASGLIEQLL